MGRNGKNDGLKQGRLQGAKTGFGFSRMESGLKKGVVSESGMHNKIQDPTLLQGSKKPSSFWLADYATATGAGATITALSELISGATAFTILSSPAYQPPYSGNGGVYNNKAYIDFNSGADLIYTSLSTMGSGKNELTLMMVVRLSTTSTTTLFYSVDSTISTTVGDIRVESIGGNKIRVTFIGNPTSTSSVYETYDSTLEGNNWHLLTVKFRLYQPGGQGSEMELWLNGNLNMAPVTTTFGGSTSTFVGNSYNIGNNSSQTAGGSNMAAFLTLDYWVNSSEQMRLENFFRWYYGRRF
jgi:hypothetical protein